MTTKMATRNQLNLGLKFGAKKCIDDNMTSKKKRTVFGDVTNLHAQQAVTKAGKKKQTMTKKPMKRISGGRRKVDALVVKDKENGDNATDLSYEIIQLSQPDSQSSQGSTETEMEVSMEEQNKSNLLKWVDFDKESGNDIYQLGIYAHHIFQYYKTREAKFAVSDYMARQTDLTPNMRSILVDWLVEVQENFELNHETLYLAVKLVDLYLDRVLVARDRLQLVGASALFVACKFDERSPPVLDDFLYICDDAYTRQEVIQMEQNILRAVGFDLGAPLSYRFLRRYARVAKAPIPTLTLARFILETSLMDLSFSALSESMLAAACLYLSQKMTQLGSWDDTLIYFTGYRAEILVPLVTRLNTMLKTPVNKQLQTIKGKYSHEVFHRVATIAPLEAAELDQLSFSDERRMSTS